MVNVPVPTTWWFPALCLMMYLPLYFNGAPATGRRCNPAVGALGIWRWIWLNIFQLPLSESRWRKEDFSEDGQYIFGSHPHGVMSVHHIGTMMCPAVCVKGKAFADLSPMRKRRDLAAAVLFRIPLLRELSLLAGAVDADRKVASRMLKKGLSVGVLVGGEQEQLLSQRGEHLAYVKARKGHIKLALRHGVPLVPCYCFGETDLYWQSKLLFGLRRWLVKRLGIALTLPVGRSWLLPLLPKRGVKLVHCVGTPIEVPLVDEPTNAQIEQYHAAYVAGLVKVFDENKAACGYPDAQLVLA